MKRIAGPMMVFVWLLVGVSAHATSGLSCLDEVSPGNWVVTGACYGQLNAEGGETVTINEGAKLNWDDSKTADITLFSSGYTLLNQGDINNYSGAAVSSSAENQVIDNRLGASISGSTYGIMLGDNSRIINAGYINYTPPKEEAPVDPKAEKPLGMIMIGDTRDGVVLGSGNLVDNTGFISSSPSSEEAYAIRGLNNNVINNDTEGTLIGSVKVTGTGNIINNEGLIDSPNKYGVMLYSYSDKTPVKILEPRKSPEPVKIPEPLKPVVEVVANRLVNSGTIEADAYPVYISGSGDFINRGTIVSHDREAVHLESLSPEAITQNVTLLEGSDVQGDLYARSDVFDVRLETKNANSINLNLDGSGDFGHLIYGFTSLTKTGEGVWSLTAKNELREKVDLGEIGLIKQITIEEGTLAVDGRLDFMDGLLVDEAGVLSGSGQLVDKGRKFGVNNQGIVAPGNSIGTLLISGNYTQGLNGQLKVEIGDGQSDLLDISGVAMIEGGGLHVIPVGELVDGEFYSILEADNGVTGEFDSVIGSLLWDFDVAYESKQILIEAIEHTYAELGLSNNQITMFEELEEAAEKGNPEAQALIELLNQASADGRGGALLSGWSPDQYPSLIDASLAGFNLYGSSIAGRMGNLHLAATRHNPVYAENTNTLTPAGPTLSRLPAFERRADGWSGWARLLGLTGDQNHDSESQGFEFDSYGLSLGFDNQVSDNLALGIGFGYAESDVDFDRDGQSSTMDSFHGGLYATYSTERFYIDGALLYATNDYDSKRREDGTGLKATSETDGDEFGAMLATGITLYESDSVYFTPTASIEWAQINIDGFTEKGALLNYVVDDFDADSAVTTLGFSLGGKMGEQGSFLPELRLAWAHEYGDTERDVKSSFEGSSSSFLVAGKEPEEDSFLAGLGFNAYLGEQLTLYADYDGEFRSDFEAHSFALGMRYDF